MGWDLWNRQGMIYFNFYSNLDLIYFRYNLQFVSMADLMIPNYYAFCDKLYINYYQYDLNTRMTKSDDIIFFQISFERIKGLSQHYLNLGSLLLLK